VNAAGISAALTGLERICVILLKTTTTINIKTKTVLFLKKISAEPKRGNFVALLCSYALKKLQ